MAQSMIPARRLVLAVFVAPAFLFTEGAPARTCGLSSFSGFFAFFTKGAAPVIGTDFDFLPFFAARFMAYCFERPLRP